jgi:hypothetical protein
MHLVEDKAVFIIRREGFYPKLGSLTTGSGFAYVGYRDRDLFDNRGTLDLGGATSLRGRLGRISRQDQRCAARFPDDGSGRAGLPD